MQIIVEMMEPGEDLGSCGDRVDKKCFTLILHPGVL